MEVVWTGLSEKGRAVCDDQDFSGAQREREKQGGKKRESERASEREESLDCMPHTEYEKKDGITR